MKKYTVWYNGWGIPVEAENIKQARHKAYLSFKERFTAEYGKFMRGIDEVEERDE